MFILVLFIFLGGAIAIFISMIKIYKDDAKMKEKKEASLTPEQRHEREINRRWEHFYGTLPQCCPNCGKTNMEESNGFPCSKWKLISTKTEKFETFDKAYTLGGSTTVFKKEKTKEVKTYKCPNCNYTHTM